jgi:hypothetical protein
VLYAFYVIRGLIPRRQYEDEKQSLCPGDVESGYTDEKCTAAQEKPSDLGSVPGTGTPQISHPPVGVPVNIDEDVMMVDAEFPDAIENTHSSSKTHPAPPEVPSQPWLVPLPPSPTSSPLRLTIQLDEDAPMEGNSQLGCAMVASDEQRRPDARTGNAAPAAIDLALAMQLRTGFGATADAAWLMRFLMALFGWITVFIGGGGGRTTGRRLLER